MLSVEYELLIDFNMPCEGIYYWKGMNGKYSLHESLQEARYIRGAILIFRSNRSLWNALLSIVVRDRLASSPQIS